MNNQLLSALYGLGAEVVLTVTDARTGNLVFQFPGQDEPLDLALPAGHYLVIRVADRPGVQPGLLSVTNPDPQMHGGHPTVGPVNSDKVPSMPSGRDQLAEDCVLGPVACEELQPSATQTRPDAQPTTVGEHPSMHGVGMDTTYVATEGDDGPVPLDR